MRLSFILLGAAGALTGCQTFPPGAERGPSGTMAYQVPITASHPGTKIYADGQLVGEAPVTLKVYGDTDGTFHNFGSDQYVLQAVPAETNLHTQIRVFHTGGLFMPEDKIPAGVQFDMNRPSPVYVRGPGPSYYYPPPYYYGWPYYYGPRYYFYGSYSHGYHHHYHHGHHHHSGGLRVR